jgi:hypothetical protein
VPVSRPGGLIASRDAILRLWPGVDAGAQPADLAAVVDLVLSDMKPRPMRVHCRRGAERSLQPCIIPRGQALEGETANLAELMKIVVTRPVAEEAPRFGTKR